MNTSIARELADILGRSTSCEQFAHDAPLRVAASILSGSAGQVTATTVVGVLGRGGVGSFRALVEDIAQEYGLQASLRFTSGSYSVRFSI